MTDTTDTPPEPACPQCDGQLDERPSPLREIYWCDSCSTYIEEP
jgi:formamidopyrimidine-DNA glycosylase